MSTLSAIAFRHLLLVLSVVLAISFLLTPSRSFAQTTTPTYLACTTTTSFGVKICTSQYLIIAGSTPDPNTYISWPIGTVNTTAVPETQAAYFSCTSATNFGIQTCTGVYQIFLGSPPNPSNYISTLIGYVYPTAVAGTEVAYLACTLQTTFGVSKCSGAYSIIRGSTPSSSVYQSWIIGYVTP
jgi:hypothetical protein